MALAEQKDRNIEMMRGVAVLIVVVYHYTTRLPPSALGVTEAASIETHIGKIGVYLFFVISGFLIARSIEASGDLASFYAKRISRIWPLFALASVVVFVSMKLFDPPRVLEGDTFYADHQTIGDLVGSIFFLRDLGFEWADGAYWSILVEMKFYFIVGLFAVAFRERFIDRFAVFTIVVCAFDLVLVLSASGSEVRFAGAEHLRLLSKAFHGGLVSIYLPLFALGMLLHRGRHDAVFCATAALTAVTVVIGIAEDGKFDAKKDSIFLLALALVLFLDHLLLRSRIFLWIGRYSYSIYLFHQMIGLTLIAGLAPRIGIDAAVLVALALVFLIAWLGSRLVEWRYRRSLIRLLRNLFARIGLDRMPLAGPPERPENAFLSTPQPVAKG